MAKEFSVEQHMLVPRHSKLSEKEKKELLEKYNISVAELPKIMKSDAAIQKLAAKPGDVIRIERNSPTAGTIDFFRVVVNG